MRAHNHDRLQIPSLFLAALIVTLPASCKSGKSTDPVAAGSAAAAHLDVGCMLDHVQRPTESFHYSYKYADSSSHVDEEADVTPQAMDINITDPSGTRTYHGVRGDEHSWDTALLDLSSLSFTGMTGRMAGYDGTSVIQSRGAEAVNGFSATRYEINSNGANAADREMFTTLFGLGSFDKGTVWMGSDGCAVKVLLDEGLSQPNGQVEKRHFEINRLKRQAAAARAAVRKEAAS